jgi:hypothetical protein
MATYIDEWKNARELSDSTRPWGCP